MPRSELCSEGWTARGELLEACQQPGLVLRVKELQARAERAVLDDCPRGQLERSAAVFCDLAMAGVPIYQAPLGLLELLRDPLPWRQLPSCS